MTEQQIKLFDNLSVDNIKKDIDKQYKQAMKQFFGFSNIEISIISQSSGENFPEKIKNFYNENKNSSDVIKKSLAKKIEKKIGEEGLEKGIKNFKKLILLIKNLEKAKSIKSIIKIMETDNFEFFLKLMGLNKKNFGEGKYIATPVLSSETNKLLEETSKIWEIKKEINDLKTEIGTKVNILTALKIDQNKLNQKLNLENLRISELHYIIQFQKILEKIPNNVADILTKEPRNFSLKEIELLSSCSSNILQLVLIGSSLELISSENVKSVKKLLKEVIAFQQSNIVVTNSEYIFSKKKSTNILHNDTEYHINIDDLKYLDYMAFPEKYKEFLNGKIGTQVLFYHLIKKDIKYNTLKEAFLDFKRTNWYKILPQDIKTKFDIISNFVNISQNYKNFKENIEMYRKNQKRAENLVVLLDVYSKGILGEGINPKSYKKLTTYIFSGNWKKFEKEYNKLYENVCKKAEGYIEFDGWELPQALVKVGIPMAWSNGISLETSSLRNWKNFKARVIWQLPYPNFKQIFSEKNSKLDNLANIYDIIEDKLIPNMLDEKTDKIVKENLIYNNVDVLLVKLYNSQLKTPEVISNNGKIIYKYNNKELIFDERGNIYFKSDIDGEKLNALKIDFKQVNNKLLFGNLEIDIENGLPRGFKNRIKMLSMTYKIGLNSLAKIKEQFRKTYILISFLKLSGAPIGYSLISMFNQLGFILFGNNFNSTKLIKVYNPEIKSSYENRISLESMIDKYLNDKNKIEKVDKMIEHQRKTIPLWQKQLLCKKLNVNIENCCDIIPTPVKEILRKKVVTQAFISQKVKIDYLIFNTSDSKLLKQNIKNLQINNWDKICAITEVVIKELIPIMIATIIANIVVPETIALDAEIYETFTMARFLRYGINTGKFLLRYGFVEPTVYTASSNLIHGNGFSFTGRTKNTEFYLLAPLFGKGFENIGGKLTGKLSTKPSKISSYLWQATGALSSIEATNLAIDGKIDISQVPYDLLFIALLHGTHKVIDPAMEKMGLNGILWGKNNNIKLPEFNRSIKNIKFKLGEFKENIKNQMKYMKFFEGAELVFKKGDGFKNTLWLKNGELYKIVKEDNSNKFSVKKVSELEGINIDKVIYSDLKQVFVVLDKSGSLIIKYSKGEEIIIQDFVINGKISLSAIDKVKGKIEELNKQGINIELSGSKGFTEFEKAIKEISNNELLLNNLKADIEKLSDSEIKKLDLFKKTKKLLKEKFKKEGMSEIESDKKAEKVSIGVVKGVLKGSLSVLRTLTKLPFNVAGKLFKYSFYVTVIGGGAVAYDYFSDGHLNIYDWFKKHGISIGLSTAGTFLGSRWKNHPLIGKIIGSIAGWIVGKKFYDFIKENPNLVDNTKLIQEKVEKFVDNLFN